MFANVGIHEVSAEDAIIHDGEFNFLKAQHGKKWEAEDKIVETQLAEIRAKNGGSDPIFYTY